MRLYILSNLIPGSFKTELSEIASDVVYLTNPQKLGDVIELQSEEEKMIVIDPDFVDWEVSDEDLKSVKNLKAVFVSSTSFGWVAQEYLNQNHIPLSNVKDWCTQSVAEWAIMMAFNLSRKIPLLIQDSFPLDYGKYQGVELKGKTVGIIGLGNIGKAIAERSIGLGMNVIYWSNKSKDENYKYVELPELFKEADFIFPTMADNDESKKVITDELIQSLKSNAVFVSIVHKYYNHDLLMQMVIDGKLFGYGFEDSNVKMTDLKGNIWVAPEYAWCTINSSENNDAKLLDNLKAALNGDFPSRVN